MSNTLYPIGIQNFEKLRKNGYLYIDKTAQVYQLAKTGSYYFLSRPRRFGKRLLISTSKLTFKESVNCLKDLPSRNWKRSGNSIPFCTST